MSKVKNTNPLGMRHVGINALNPFCSGVSASRGLMTVSQLAQKQNLKNPDLNLIQSGLEPSLAKHVYNVVSPDNLRVLDIIYLNPSVQNVEHENVSTAITIIYESIDKNEIGIIKVPTHHSLHSRLGFNYIHTPLMERLTRNAILKKGDILATPKSTVVEDEYNFGVNLNVALLSLPGTAEDGAIINEDTIARLGYESIEKIIIEIKPDEVPLNLYGDENTYKSAPEIGDIVRSDGVIMATRKIQDNVSPVQLAPSNLRKISWMEDTIYYSSSFYEGVIEEVDVIVSKDRVKTFEGMSDQLDNLADNRLLYYKRILAAYNSWKNTHTNMSSPYTVTPELTTLVNLARIYTGDHNKNINKNYKKAPLPPYRIQVTVKRTLYPWMSSKLTDLFGGKAVITSTLPGHAMPVAKDGTVADICMSPEATLNRSIPKRLCAQYINQTCMHVGKEVAAMLNISPDVNKRTKKKIVSSMIKENHAIIDNIVSYLNGFYSIASERMVFDRSMIGDDILLEHILNVVNKGAVINLSVDDLSIRGDKERVIDLENSIYRPMYDTVSYKIKSQDGNSWETITTDDKCRIGPLYYILLERDGSDLASTDSVKLQSMGLTATKSDKDRFRNPISRNNVAVLGNDEANIVSETVTSDSLAEMADRMMSPSSVASVSHKLLTADKPNGIKTLLNRRSHPYGGSKSLELISHILGAYGIELYDK